MTQAVRYGVVGAGRVFQRFHLPCLRERPEVSLVAVCDADVDQARATIGDLLGDALVTSDLTEFFAAGRPDVVAVCTPNDAHTVPVLAALARGAAVLCEKPLAADLDEAHRIARADEAGLVAVNLPYRFHELVPAFADLLPDGQCEITLRFTTAGQRLWRPVTRWYGDPAKAGGGALLDLGPHALDLLVALFGWPEVVGCRTDQPVVEERAVVDLRFAKGSARLLISRESRTMGLSVHVRQGDTEVTFDLRRGEVRTPDHTVTARDARPELAAISRFFDAVTGGPALAVTATEAVRLQALVADAYAIAAHDPALTI